MLSSLPAPLGPLLKGDGVIWILTKRNVQALQGARRGQKEFLGGGVGAGGDITYWLETENRKDRISSGFQDRSLRFPLLEDD